MFPWSPCNPCTPAWLPLKPAIVNVRKSGGKKVETICVWLSVYWRNKKGSEIRKRCIKLIGKLWGRRKRTRGDGGVKIVLRPHVQTEAWNSIWETRSVKNAPHGFPLITFSSFFLPFVSKKKKEKQEENLTRNFTVEVLNLIFHVYRLSQ